MIRGERLARRPEPRPRRLDTGTSRDLDGPIPADLVRPGRRAARPPGSAAGRARRAGSARPPRSTSSPTASDRATGRTAGPQRGLPRRRRLSGMARSDSRLVRFATSTSEILAVSARRTNPRARTARPPRRRIGTTSYFLGGRRVVLPSPIPSARCSNSALDGIALRQRVIADNIANVDTPGYRATSVDFETSLRAAIASGDPSAARRPRCARPTPRWAPTATTSTSARRRWPPSSPSSSTRSSPAPSSDRFDLIKTVAAVRDGRLRHARASPAPRLGMHQTWLDTLANNIANVNTVTPHRPGRLPGADADRAGRAPAAASRSPASRSATPQGRLVSRPRATRSPTPTATSARPTWTCPPR